MKPSLACRVRRRSSERTYKPGSVSFNHGLKDDDHFSREPIASAPQAIYPEVDGGPDRSTEPRHTIGIVGAVHSFLFDLAPGGVCLARLVAQPAGELLPHRFTLTPRLPAKLHFGPLRGGLLSVALSRALRPVGVTHHHVLRSPDFPPADAVSGPIWRLLAARPATVRSTPNHL